MGTNAANNPRREFPTEHHHIKLPYQVPTPPDTDEYTPTMSFTQELALGDTVEIFFLGTLYNLTISFCIHSDLAVTAAASKKPSHSMPRIAMFRGVSAAGER